MSRDIRSYFSAGAASKKPSKITDDSPRKSSYKERSKIVGGKKTRHVILDSDSEEDPLPPSPKRRKSSSGSGKKESIISKETPNLVPVNIADVFGSKPVERVERPPQEYQSATVKREEEHSTDDKSCKPLASPVVSPESSDGDFSAKKIDQRLQKEIKSPKKETRRKSEEEVNLDHHEKGRKRSDSEHDKKHVHVNKDNTPTKVSDLVKKREGSASKKCLEKEVKSETGCDSSEKKKQHAVMYQKYLHREGPKHPGSKEIPEGHPNCLNGLAFVITGVLDSMDREEASALVQRCGGKVTTSVSRNTSYIVLGDEPGPAKLEKAKNLGIKELDEDGLLDLIKARTNEVGCATVEPAESLSSGKKRQKESLHLKAPKVPKLNEDGRAARKLHYSSQDNDLSSDSKRSDIRGDTSVDHPKESSVMWVDKYKPANTKQIIGQQGERSNVNKLKRWLSLWHKYHGKGGSRPPRPGPWDKNDDGGYYKAALLSGAPGIGKTTSAHLVCDELGMDAIEMNASDTRSKKLLEQEVAELVTNQTLSSYFTHGEKQSSYNENSGRKKVLLMDEVDGMAGNEDRGGIAALIQLIKESCIPIICMCNDRAHPKIRSLVGHCYDLRFQRPRMEQIRGAMMSICFKEGLKVNPEALGDLISSTNQDVRQVLHQLNMWAADKNIKPKSETGNRRKGLKDVRLGPWDVLRKVFSADERKKTDLNQQTELFFYDYNLGPLFVFENYPKVSPNAARNMKQKLDLLAQTAESLVKGDIIQRIIRRDNAWKLLPAQAIFSSVLPGSLMEGHMTAQIDFPAFLGKTSTKGKMERLMQEITLHTKTTTRATKESTKLDYLSYLRDAIVKPLIDESRGELASGEGVHNAIEVMHGYSLLREDLDSILELTHFPGTTDPMSSVHTKVKAAFTRAYNKEGMLTPYAVTMNVKKKRGAVTDDYGSEQEEEEEEDEEGDPLADAMIKVKKATKTSGRGRGGGQGRGSHGGGSSSEEGGRRGRGRGKRGK